jgi:hypothetical protein
MITLTPPEGKTPFKRITLHSGTTYFPDFSKGGQVKISDEADAQELIAEGWLRDAASTKAARFDVDLLRKGMAAQLRRTPGVGESFEQDRKLNDMQLAEFNVQIGGERVRVRRGEHVIVVAGIEVPIGELAPQVRRELAIATARLDGASFDIDANLLGVQEARQAITAAIIAVMGDKAFRDRLIVSGTRRAN